MKNKRIQFTTCVILELISRINLKTYEAKIRKYERLMKRAEMAKDRRSEILSMASSTMIALQSFFDINEEQSANAKSKSTKKPDTKSRKTNSR